jgi:hypothetical protein
MKRICLAAAASLALMLAVFPAPSYAKKVSNHAAAGLMSICLLDGGRTSEPNNGKYVKCCTKEGGYCIICQQNGSGQCNRMDYSPLRASGQGNEASAPGTVAPAQASPRRSIAPASTGLSGE